MSYSEFTSLVPNETLEFINNAMFLAAANASSEKGIREKFIKYAILLNANKVYKSSISIACAKCDSKYKARDLFEIIKDEVLIYSDRSKYLSMYPYDILLYIRKHYSDGYYDTIDDIDLSSDSLLSNTQVRDNKLLKEKNEKVNSKIVSELKPEIYILFKTASKIRNYLLRDESHFKYNSGGIEAYSLIMALYYFDNPEAKSIVSYFESKGLNLSCFDKSTNLNISKSYILDLDEDVDVISMYYMDYIKRLGKDSSICDIVSLAFDNSYTHSGIIDSFLSNYGLISSDFSDISSKLESTKIEREQAEYIKQTNEFYKKFDRQTIDFIKLVFKIYTLIMDKLSKGECNADIIKCSDDVDTLSILIASYYYDGEVSNYFIDHGIKLEDIFKFLKLNINESSIESTKIDEVKLISIFKRFVNDGVNRNSNKIDYNSIISNLCNRDFNKSFILEEIFGNFTDESLASDFSSNLKKHFQDKEKERKNYVRNALFKDLDYDVIKLLENASIYYISLKYIAKNGNVNILKKMKEEDFIPLSILYAAGNNRNTEIYNYLEKIGLKRNSLTQIFSGYNLNSVSSDIDIINEKFNNIIFGGINSSKKREDISVASIITNAFDESLYSSIELRDFLNGYNVDYSVFSDFENNFDSYKNGLVDERNKQEYKERLFNKLSDRCSRAVIGYAIDIYDRLNSSKLSNDDKKFFSLLIAVMYSDESANHYFDKNNINVKQILSSLELDRNILIGISSDVDFRKYESYFGEYLSDLFKNKSSINVNDINEFLFNKNNKKFISLCGNKYERVSVEVVRKVDYEETLSLSDKAKLLKSEEVEDLDIDSMTSLVSYGNNLVNYSRELQRVPRVEVNSNPLLEITKIIERVKPKQVKTYKGFFMTQEVIETVPGEEVTPEIINELTNKINDALDSLRNDIVNYADVIEYIKAYIIKIKEYIVKVDNAINVAKNKYDNTSDELEKYECKLVLDNLLSMKNNLENSVVVWKQEQLKYLQLSSNHFMNINSLTLTRDSLLPLISSESLLNKGLISESDSMKLQSSIFGILDSLVSRNATQAQSNLDQMRQLSLPQDLMRSIESTIDLQIQDNSGPKLELK